MPTWTARKYKLPNQNFEATAIRIDDGRVGICYHGSTIWQEGDKRWDESVGEDWQAIWKYGRPCAFHELPEDMRLYCPKCGTRVFKRDRECPRCGIILEKAAAAGETPATETADIPEKGEKKRRSRAMDLALVVIVLAITGSLAYKLLQPGEPESSPDKSASTVEATSPDPTQQPSPQAQQPQKIFVNREPRKNQRQPHTADMPETSRATPTSVSPSDFYSHIDLNNQAEARATLQEEIKKIERERRQIEQARAQAETPAKKKKIREKIKVYQAKSRKLKSLIDTYNAKYSTKGQP